MILLRCLTICHDDMLDECDYDYVKTKQTNKTIWATCVPFVSHATCAYTLLEKLHWSTNSLSPACVVSPFSVILWESNRWSTGGFITFKGYLIKTQVDRIANCAKSTESCKTLTGRLMNSRQDMSTFPAFSSQRKSIKRSIWMHCICLNNWCHIFKRTSTPCLCHWYI